MQLVVKKSLKSSVLPALCLVFQLHRPPPSRSIVEPHDCRRSSSLIGSRVLYECISPSIIWAATSESPSCSMPLRDPDIKATSPSDATEHLAVSDYAVSLCEGVEDHGYRLLNIHRPTTEPPPALIGHRHASRCASPPKNAIVERPVQSPAQKAKNRKTVQKSGIRPRLIRETPPSPLATSITSPPRPPAQCPMSAFTCTPPLRMAPTISTAYDDDGRSASRPMDKLQLDNESRHELRRSTQRGWL
eukprot:CAMPEP_0184725390 /NCGR_PEP_ID=MMETSP0314-20130426/30833_1 /TAXON_ID=38298 /ORGANISM="Rhodella maculata, Strain CCMP 736" /LENGTH=245 /DNA_ID=CAMNT_0027190609 /DNA_START=168 /DNA_END=904 /DNA_ORIENTATION=+